MEAVHAPDSFTQVPSVLSLKDEAIDDLNFESEEFSEEDVLPFLLQAQDIIAKLESRVVDLETDLSTIHRKYEHDRHDWLVGLSQKDQYIHHLSNKLQRLEFNGKEAILLLSDAVTAPDLPEALQASLSLALNYLRQAHLTSTPPADPAVAVDLTGIDDLEEGELERRAAAVNEWRKQEDTDGSLRVSQWAHQQLLLESSTQDGSQADTEPFSTTTSLSSMTRMPSAEGHVNSNPVAAATAAISNGSNNRSLATTGATVQEQGFCSNCKQLLTQLDQQIEQKAYMKRDLSALASALSEEEQLRFSIEEVKESLEEDIRDVTTNLFKVLNCILMDEIMDREGLIQLDREMGGKLANVLKAWDVREERLKDIKEQLVDLDAAVHQSATESDRINRRSEDAVQSVLPNRLSMIRHSSIHHPRISSPASPLVPLSEDDSLQGIAIGNTRTVRLDGLVFDEFQEHIKTYSPTSAFLKRVTAEDIDPCLFQNTTSLWWKSPWFKRKLTDAIANNRCDIQTWNNSNSAFSSSSSSSPATSHISVSSSATNQQQPAAPRTKCTCCGHLRICEFRMRLHGPPQQKPVPWLPLDRFCRDRIVAVCDFYSFMSHLRQGYLQNTPVLYQFKQCLHYRRRMGMARVGSMDIFDDDPKLQPSSYQSKRRSRKRESLVLDHSGSGSDTGSVVSVTDIQGLGGSSQIVIVH
ncbi:hypothetical protein BX666DRAFT_1886125 [Dichotomocladium elegans]|nr:hypothetical protein BX666DRAFT_1886125 [Dichotomocladium elegans]